MKVASYNIHKCRGVDGVTRPDRIIGVIRELGADVIALQEVDRRFGRRGGLLDPSAIERETGMQLLVQSDVSHRHGWHGNALLVRAVTSSGRDAIGARLTLTSGGRKQIDEVRSGGYHISQGDFRVHFGMGHATKADLTIRWPDGPVSNVENIPSVAANQWIVVREGRGIVERHPFNHDPP